MSKWNTDYRRFFEHLQELKVLVFDRPWNKEYAIPKGETIKDAPIGRTFASLLWILENNTGAEGLYHRTGIQITGKRNCITTMFELSKLRA